MTFEEWMKKQDPAIVKDAAVSADAIKAGLQQCVIENKTVWQKECSK